jgi:hypothetical protein
MSTDDKEKVRIDDLPVPVKDMSPDEEEEVKGGLGIVNPTRPPIVNPESIKKPILDSY